MRSFLITSIAVGVSSTVLGLILSYLIDKPSGAIIVLVASAVLGFNLLFRRQGN